jgi:hypothetical protein
LIMMGKTLAVLPVVALLACSEPTASPLEPLAAQMSKTAVGGRAGALGTVFVSSQGLYYDTFVSAETLPPHGRFQQLVDGVTEFGPGDPGYLGGRWWVDVNATGIQDSDDNYLLCPLLGPGRTSP